MKALRTIGAAILVLQLLIFSVYAAIPTVIEDDSKPVSGSGSAEDPNVYLVNADTKLTWKHLNDNKENEISELYEFREGDEQSGKLLYSWLFEAEELTGAEGPYFLGINRYSGDETKSLSFADDAFYFSFATKRDFPGRVKIKLAVDGSFSDGNKLYLYYYGGYDSTVLHGSSPVKLKDEILELDGSIEETAADLEVSGGYVEFYVRHGGNYFLTSQKTEYKGEENPTDVEHYSAETVLGTANALFPTAGIASAVEDSLSIQTTDTLCQGDIDAVKKLYLANLELTDTKELERLYFKGLESLTLSGNKLTELGSFSMPSLTYLDLSDNSLELISNVLKLPALESLVLKGNKITSLPDLSELEGLESLDISGNELEIIPRLTGASLRYIDASNNHLTSAPELSGCAKLEKINLLGQTCEKSAELAYGEEYTVDPAPELIAQYGDSGTVAITDKNGKAVYETDFSELETGNYSIATSALPGGGEYTLLITGYSGGEVLGTYTYHLALTGGASPYIWLAAAAVLIAACIAGFMLYRKKGRSNRNER